VAGPDRMTIEEVVRKVLLDEHADVIREAAWRRRCPFHTQLGRALRSKPISRVLLLRRGGERLGVRFPDSCSGRQASAIPECRLLIAVRDNQHFSGRPGPLEDRIATPSSCIRAWSSGGPIHGVCGRGTRRDAVGCRKSRRPAASHCALPQEVRRQPVAACNGARSASEADPRDGRCLARTGDLLLVRQALYQLS
jgi:hypothetical protein